jgi:Domain of unknown function (DUF5615)
VIPRLLADADLKSAIVSGTIRRNTELDFRRAQDVPLDALDDGRVLELAAEDNRVLISHDVNTMPVHFREFTRDRVSPGLILIPQQLNIGAAIESLLTICEACDGPDLENLIYLLPSMVMYRF